MRWALRPGECDFRLIPDGVLGLLVFLTLLAPFSAWSAEPPVPVLQIDDNGPVITIKAREVTLPDLLRELSKRLHFAIEGTSALDQETKLTVSYKGNLEDLLQRYILAGKGFVTFYKGSAVDRVLILGGTGSINPEPAGGQTATARAPGGPASASSPAVQASTAPQLSPVNTMLQTQVSVQQPPPANPGTTPMQNTSAAAGQGASTPLATLTQTARQNVSALSSALRSVCIGPNCR